MNSEAPPLLGNNVAPSFLTSYIQPFIETSLPILEELPALYAEISSCSIFWRANVPARVFPEAIESEFR